MPTLMTIDDASMQTLEDPANNFPETGMGLYVVQTDQGVIAVQSGGVALPCYDASPFYNLSDLEAGIPAPARQPHDQPFHINPIRVFANRFEAQQAIAGHPPAPAPPLATVPPGAVLLFAKYALQQATVFLRFLCIPIDMRFVAGQLLQHTYLSTRLENRTANSGFAAVGRFALPLPAPARYVIEYELPALTLIEVGTVAPLFGQSGGGVEVRLMQATRPIMVNSFQMPEY